MYIKLSPLVHIEIVVKDAEAAYQFLHQSFGAEKIQEEFAAFLDSDFARIIHVGLGNVVLQFVQPILEQYSWYEQMKSKGPGVHNLTFIVEDIRKTVQALQQEEISTLIEFPLAWGDLIGKDNVRQDAKPVFMMETMNKLGFHLELTESPYMEETTSVLSPPQTLIGRVSPMLHIELVVNDIDETYSLLHKIFGSEKVEIEFASFLDSPFMRIMHVNLSNVVLQYCQPLAEQGSWYEQLKTKGPGVHNITFVVPDMAATMSDVEKAGGKDLFTFPLDWGRLVGPENVKPEIAPVHMINAMDIVGFHIELGERPTDKPLDFLFCDINGFPK